MNAIGKQSHQAVSKRYDDFPKKRKLPTDFLYVGWTVRTTNLQHVVPEAAKYIRQVELDDRDRETVYAKIAQMEEQLEEGVSLSKHHFAHEIVSLDLYHERTGAAFSADARKCDYDAMLVDLLDWFDSIDPDWLGVRSVRKVATKFCFVGFHVRQFQQLLATALSVRCGLPPFLSRNGNAIDMDFVFCADAYRPRPRLIYCPGTVYMYERMVRRHASLLPPELHPDKRKWRLTLTDAEYERRLCQELVRDRILANATDTQRIDRR